MVSRATASIYMCVYCRLDCLRRISKGTVDFGVFSPEDLVAARWANVDVLVTNELRDRDKQFERSVVAVVNRRILPDSAAPLTSILRNSSLCHPGVGLDDLRPLSDTLSGVILHFISFYPRLRPRGIKKMHTRQKSFYVRLLVLSYLPINFRLNQFDRS
ncbi:hypothetical protein RR48_00500 [Papilio machaon]|uniref:Uncharacterized protein n=1 Tax=Papilio machaon TaxID=76193 RepID=A0A0N1PJC4_PAPMA|nr:hypothetical protein RR48_00500 [Papilio machaon]